MNIIIDIFLFLAGFALGNYARSLVFSRMEWNILKWDNDVFAYRLAQKGSVFHRGDKIFMAVRVPTAGIPEEGTSFE